MIPRNPNCLKNSAILCRRATISGFTHRPVEPARGLEPRAWEEHTMRVAAAVMVVAMVAFGAGPAAAQIDESRFLLSLNLGLQPGSDDYADDGPFTLYDEAGALAVSGETSTGALFDLGAAYRVARPLHDRPGLPARRPVTTTPWESAAWRPTPSSSTGRGRSRSPADDARAQGASVPLQRRLPAAAHRPARPAHLRRAVAVPVVPAGGGVGDRDRGSPPFTTVTVTPTIETREENAWGAHLGFDAAYTVAANGSSTFGRRRLPPLRRGERRHSRRVENGRHRSRRLPVRRRRPLPLLVVPLSLRARRWNMTRRRPGHDVGSS